jgi:hypothetical protein
METIPVGQAVLLKVVATLGGTAMAAECLAISPTLISRFLDGKIPVPDGVLLRAVDIVLGHPQELSGRRRSLRSVQA